MSPTPPISGMKVCGTPWMLGMITPCPCGAELIAKPGGFAVAPDIAPGISDLIAASGVIPPAPALCMVAPGGAPVAPSGTPAGVMPGGAPEAPSGTPAGVVPGGAPEAPPLATP